MERKAKGEGLSVATLETPDSYDLGALTLEEDQEPGE